MHKWLPLEVCREAEIMGEVIFGQVRNVSRRRSSRGRSCVRSI
jgi:hypothetical protein